MPALPRPALPPLLAHLFCLFLLLACGANGQTPWIESQRQGNEARFLFPSQIQRYDLAAKSWLPAITLPRGGATAMAADAQGAAVAYGTSVYRYSTTFTGESLVGTTSSAVHNLFVDGNLLIAVHSSGLYANVTIFDRSSATQLSTRSTYIDSMFGASHAPESNRLYGRTQGVSPSDIVTASYTDEGISTNAEDSPYHGTYPSGTKTWIFPNEARVIDSAGTLYSAPGLTHLGTLGSGLIDIAFNGDVPIVLQTGNLIAFTTSMVETGRVALTTTATSELHVTPTEAFVFSPTTGTPSVQTISLGTLNAPVPFTPINPTGLAYPIDDAFLDKDGNVLLFSKAQLSLFRWSPTERRYTGSFLLTGVPDFAAYSAETHSAYFAYASRAIRRMDLAATTPAEAPLLTLPEKPIGLATAGPFIFAADPSGSWDTHYVFSPTGTQLDAVEWNHFSRVWQWDPVKRRMYFFRDGQSPSDLLFETIDPSGKITDKGETPYHGTFTVTPPIRVTPDGSKVVIGSGVVFETDGLTTIANLANGFTDAAWSGSDLISIRAINGLTQLQTWQGTQFVPGPITRQFNGTPQRLFNTPQGLLLVTSIENTPRFILLDAALNPLFISPTRPVTPTQLAVTGRTVDSVSLSWTDASDNEDGFRIESRIGAGAWTTAATAAPNATTATATGLNANTTYEFRVIATASTLESAPSNTTTARTLSSPDEPAGEPYNLRITRIFANSITLEWQDNGTNETGFRILRSTTANGPVTTFTAPAGATSFTNTGLAANTNYFYRIQIVKDFITGDLSSQITGRTLSSNSAPSFSSSITVTAVTPTSVSLKWTDGSLNEDGFRIERSSAGDPTWTPLGTVPHNVDTFTDASAVPGTRYTYRVAAFNASGNSAFRTVTTTTPPLGGLFTDLSMRSGDVQYFAFTNPDRIERYALASRTWLAPIPLDATATALWVDPTAIFVAEGRSVVRISLDGSQRTPLANAQTNVTSLFTLNNVLAYNNSGGNFVTVDKSTGAAIATFSYSYSGTGFSTSPDQSRVFFRSSGVSPSDIHRLTFDASGAYLAGRDSPHHGDYPSATRTFPFPDGTLVADDSGTVYSTESMAYATTLAGSFTDLAFHGQEIPIVLRGNRLISYTNRLLEDGSFTLSATGLRLAVDAQDALVFISDFSSPRGLRVETVPLNQLTPPQPGAPIDPNGLPYTIDDAFVDKDGNLLLFSKSQRSLFRWSPTERNYTATFPLISAPDFAAYSPQNHSVYFAYPSQLVRQFDLSADTPLETPLFALPQPPNGLATAGEFIFASDPSGAWASHYLFSPTGTPIDSEEWNYRSRVWDWDPVKRRMYFFRDDTSPNDLHYETIDASGKITGKGETPYHGDFTVAPPIRVSPDGSKVVIGSGVIFETTDLTRLTPTVPSFKDAVWWGGKLLTIQQSLASTRLRQWDATTLAELSSLPSFPGTPVRILAVDPQTIAIITHEKGLPRIQLLNERLELIATFISTPPAVEDTPFVWTPSFEWITLGTGTPTLTAPVLPPWLRFSNGVLSGTPSEVHSGNQVDRRQPHRVVLRATNGQGQSEDREFFVTANWRNDAPTLPAALPPLTAKDTGEDILLPLLPFITDPDGRDVYRWAILENSNPRIFSRLGFTPAGEFDIAFAPYVSGTAVLTLEVTDAEGATARTSVQITLPDLPLPRITLDSTPTLSRLTGLYEQRITVTNVAARAIAGFDLSLANLREGVTLYNGSSTAAGTGSIAHHRPMQAGESVALVVEYFAVPRGAVPSPTLAAAVTEPENRLPDEIVTTQPGFEVNRLLKQADGSVVIEFNAEPGTLYRVQYSHDATQWKSCPVSIRAGGTKVQWIDRGPPWTDSHPSSAASRFYRIQRLEN